MQCAEIKVNLHSFIFNFGKFLHCHILHLVIFFTLYAFHLRSADIAAENNQKFPAHFEIDTFTK